MKKEKEKGENEPQFDHATQKYKYRKSMMQILPFEKGIGAEDTSVKKELSVCAQKRKKEVLTYIFILSFALNTTMTIKAMKERYDDSTSKGIKNSSLRGSVVIWHIANLDIFIVLLLSLR